MTEGKRMNDIEHVVVLMMENRSFDSMLGWLYEKEAPERNIPALKAGERAYEGLQGLDLQAWENVDSTGTIKAAPKRGVQGLNVPNVAPGEEFSQVSTQLFGTEQPAGDAAPTMKGYVRDYADLLRKHEFSEDQVARIAGQVLQTHTPEQLPVLNGLARHYAVCDMWFSSVPSQTNPNRAFAFCGTSMGLVNNGFLEEDRRAPDIERLVGYKLGDDRFRTRTIFNALADGGASWKIYRESGLLQNNIGKMDSVVLSILNGISPLNPLTITADVLLSYLDELSSSQVGSAYAHRLFPQILDIKDADTHFGMLDEFHRTARAGQLPNFTFLEPEWTIGEQGTGVSKPLQKALFHQGDDYHPPGNSDAGENLVKQVYLSLIANRPAWEKTLLIITFDEPVGSFDHVPPPPARPPWGDQEPAFKREHDFNFDRYGGRVPAILVSPRIQKGTVFRSKKSVPFDHTSLIATVLKWRGLEGHAADFGERTRNAPTFEDIPSLDTPRTDETDLPFLKVGHKTGEPVHFLDRFHLRSRDGKYISMFQQHAVAPFSVFSDDSTMSEYFPTLAYVDRYKTNRLTRFYCQNAADRADSGEIGTGVEVKLMAGDNGLGAYNVLGAWQDSHDCYYFNDYMDGERNKQQTWDLSKVAADGGPLRFGDKVYLTNKSYAGQRLTPDGRFVGYLTTAAGGEYWTMEPVSDEAPAADGFKTQDEFYLKHVASGKYLTPHSTGAQYYPTLGDGAERIKLMCRFAAGAYLADGMYVDLLSKQEDLSWAGTRYDVLMAYYNDWLYYYYDGYSPDYQSWVVSLESGAGLVKDGSRVRLINKGYGQYLAPSGDHLTTVKSEDANCIWILEKS
jgi:phospholipase C